jgi:hypothetical protein
MRDHRHHFEKEEPSIIIQNAVTTQSAEAIFYRFFTGHIIGIIKSRSALFATTRQLVR